MSVFNIIHNILNTQVSSFHCLLQKMSPSFSKSVAYGSLERRTFSAEWGKFWVDWEKLGTPTWGDAA